MASIRKQPERAMQISLVAWIQYHHPELFFFAVRSEQQCTPYWRQLGAKVGCKKGIFDLCFPISNGQNRGLWLELKDTKGRPSKEQLEFATMMVEQNWVTHIAYSLDEAKLILCNYYGWSNNLS